MIWDEKADLYGGLPGESEDDIVRTAIIYHEPRIKLIRLEMWTERQYEGILEINIIFYVRSTNTRFNFVYPFYLKEGTEI